MKTAIAKLTSELQDRLPMMRSQAIRPHIVRAMDSEPVKNAILTEASKGIISEVNSAAVAKKEAESQN